MFGLVLGVLMLVPLLIVCGDSGTTSGDELAQILDGTPTPSATAEGTTSGDSPIATTTADSAPSPDAQSVGRTDGTSNDASPSGSSTSDSERRTSTASDNATSNASDTGATTSSRDTDDRASGDAAGSSTNSASRNTSNSTLSAQDTATIEPEPEFEETVPQYSGGYVVQEGDTLWDIAARAGVSPDDLAAANGLGPDAYLQPDEAISVP